MEAKCTILLETSYGSMPEVSEVKAAALSKGQVGMIDIAGLSWFKCLFKIAVYCRLQVVSDRENQTLG